MLKRITLLIGLLLAPSLAFAQSSVLPFYYNSSGTKVPVGTDNPLPVTGGATGVPSDIKYWDSIALGAPSPYGTSPGAVTVPGVNANITNVNPNGQATAANSAPVVVASDQLLGIIGAGAAGAAATGNPVGTGCKYFATQPTYTDLQRSDCQSDTRGNGKVAIFGADSINSAAIQTTDADGVGGTTVANAFRVAARQYVFSGSNVVDRMFTCPSTAVVNVNNTTTELVALTSTQIIRVCSFVITSSLAGTASFVYGTGTNCGTGQIAITGAMTMAIATPIQISAANGSVMRTIASNALCLTAGTGTVTGFITYAKF